MFERVRSTAVELRGLEMQGVESGRVGMVKKYVGDTAVELSKLLDEGGGGWGFTSESSLRCRNWTGAAAGKGPPCRAQPALPWGKCACI